MRGFILLPLLFCLTILSTVWLVSSQRRYQATHSFIDELLSSKERTEVAVKAFRAALEVNQTPGSYCQNIEQPKSLRSIHAEICSTRGPSHEQIDGLAFLDPSTDQSFPIADIPRLFKVVTHCEEIGAASLTITGRPTGIHERSIVAPITCQSPAWVGTTSTSLINNFESMGTVEVQGASSMLAAGYISIPRLFVTSSKALLYAGGDLKVDQIECSQACFVTLFSQTGRVSLGSTAGPVQVRIFSRELASVGAISLSAKAPLPIIRELEIDSFRIN